MAVFYCTEDDRAILIELVRWFKRTRSTSTEQPRPASETFYIQKALAEESNLLADDHKKGVRLYSADGEPIVDDDRGLVQAKPWINSAVKGDRVFAFPRFGGWTFFGGGIVFCRLNATLAAGGTASASVFRFNRTEAEWQDTDIDIDVVDWMLGEGGSIDAQTRLVAAYVADFTGEADVAGVIAAACSADA